MLANKHLQILLLYNNIFKMRSKEVKKNRKKQSQVLQYINSNEVTFIYIALYTILIVLKQLYRVKQDNSLSIMQEDINKSIFLLKTVHW